MTEPAIPARLELAKRIATIRQSHGLTVRACARAATCAEGTWSGWERGRSQPRPASLDAIARALGCSVAALLVPAGWRAWEVRLQPATVQRLRLEGRPAAEELAQLIAAELPSVLLELAAVPAAPPHPDGRGKRRRTRAEVLAGIDEAGRMRADRAARERAGGGEGAERGDRSGLHGSVADHPGRGALSTVPLAESLLTAED